MHRNNNNKMGISPILALKPPKPAGRCGTVVAVLKCSECCKKGPKCSKCSEMFADVRRANTGRMAVAAGLRMKCTLCADFRVFFYFLQLVP